MRPHLGANVLFRRRWQLGRRSSVIYVFCSDDQGSTANEEEVFPPLLRCVEGSQGRMLRSFVSARMTLCFTALGWGLVEEAAANEGRCFTFCVVAVKRRRQRSKLRGGEDDLVLFGA